MPTGSRKPLKHSGPQGQIRPDPALVFQPWFLPTKTARAIRKLLPRGHEKRMIEYFSQFGCIKCDRREASYGGNGFCKFCRTKIQKRLKGILKRLAKITSPEGYGSKFLADHIEARRLLSGFPKSLYVKPNSKPGRKHLIHNPVHDAHIIVTSYPADGFIDAGDDRKHVFRRLF